MNIVRTLIMAVGVSSVVSIGFALAANKPAQEFATAAASSDMLEIQSSELALQKSQTPAVKDFAQMMITDHTTSSKNLAAAADHDGVTVPAEMLPKHASVIAALSAEGKAFDAAYLTAQVAAHKEALALMESYAATGDAAALKAHAEKTAPVIKMHYDHGQQLDKAM